jgi:hypothetical protein
MNAARLLSPASLALGLILIASCSNGLERYPPAIDYEQLEVRRKAALRQKAYAPAAHRGEHEDLMAQTELRLRYLRAQEEQARLRRMEFVAQAQREQFERFQEYEDVLAAKAEARRSPAARRYVARQEALDMLERSNRMADRYRSNVESRYVWAGGRLYQGEPERIQREAAEARARYEARRAVERQEAERLLVEAQKQSDLREQQTREEQERNRQMVLQQVRPLSLSSQPAVAATSPGAYPSSGAGPSASPQASATGGQSAPQATPLP